MCVARLPPLLPALRKLPSVLPVRRLSRQSELHRTVQGKACSSLYPTLPGGRKRLCIHRKSLCTHACGTPFAQADHPQAITQHRATVSLSVHLYRLRGQRRSARPGHHRPDLPDHSILPELYSAVLPYNSLGTPATSNGGQGHLRQLAMRSRVRHQHKGKRVPRASPTLVVDPQPVATTATERVAQHPPRTNERTTEDTG